MSKPTMTCCCLPDRMTVCGAAMGRGITCRYPFLSALWREATWWEIWGAWAFQIASDVPGHPP